MSTFFVESPADRRKITKKTLSQRVEVGITAVLFVMLVVICLLSLLFLSHTNRVATKGHRIVALRNERNNLLIENEILGMQIADLQSLRNLENDPQILKMINAEKPKFIRGDTAVAQILQNDLN